MGIEKIYGFGIIGTGAIADMHAEALKCIPNAKLLGVFNRSFEKANSFKDRHTCLAFDNLDDLLNFEGLDIVCICTPSGLHEDIAIKAIQKGKHCLIEKPLEITTEKCDRIIRTANANNVKLGVIFPSRFYPESKKIKAAIDKGRFGNLAIGSAYVKWSRTEAYYKQNAWRGTWELDGGGALMNQAIHAVDVLQWYMGEVESVQALTGNFRHKEIEVEDTAVAILKFSNGALGVIECSTAIYPGFLKRIEISGTEGSVIIEDADITRWEFEKEETGDELVVKKDKKHESVNGGVSNPMAISFLGHQLQIENFILSVNKGVNPFVDGNEGRKSVRIIEAIYESAATGKSVII